MFDFLSKKISGILGKEKKEGEKVDKSASAKKIMSGDFTLKDFASQLKMAGKLSSIRKFAKFIPGAGNVSDEMLEKGQEEMKRFNAIISVMTEQEQLNPNILDISAKRRIVNDAGVKVQDVDQLLQKFEQSKQFVKKFGKNGRIG